MSPPWLFLNPEVLAPAGLCCPGLHRLSDLIRRSGDLHTTSRHCRL